MTRLLPLLLLGAACGGGPHLTNLRCRASPCQGAEDPLKLLLAVDFTDDSGTLDKGGLDLRVNGNSQQTVSLGDVFSAQNIQGGSKKGTLNVDQDVQLDKLGQGSDFTVSMVATNGQGHDSNEPSLKFTVHLGGP